MKHHIYLTAEERKIVIHSLNNLRNALINDGKYTDIVDELLFKAMTIKPKAMKIKYV